VRYVDNGFGLHPKTRKTNAANKFFTFDNDNNDAYSICNGGSLQGFVGSPFAFDAIIGKCRRYQGGGGQRSEIISSNTRTALTDGNWTMGAWVRVRSLPTSNYGWVAGVIGDASSSNSNENMLFGCGIQTNGYLQIAYQHGSGIQIGFTQIDVKPRVDDWFYLTFRASWIASPATYKIEYFYNGVLMGEFTNNQRPTNGNNARFYVGNLDGVSRPANIDVCGLYFWHGNHADDEILEDARRGFCLDEKMQTKVRFQVEAQYQGDIARFYDLNQMFGYNWVKSVTWSDSIDNDFQVGSATIHASMDALSFAQLDKRTPFNRPDADDENSFRPFLENASRVRISACRLPQLIDAKDSDYGIMLEGSIERVSQKEDEITVEFRGRGGELANMFIEENRQYGAGYFNDNGGLSGATPTAIDIVAQEILDDNDNTQNGTKNLPAIVGAYAPVTVYKDADLPSTAGVIRYSQQRMPVLSAVKALVSTIGWLVRYVFNHSNLEWRYTIQNPIEKINECTFSIADYNVNSLGTADFIAADIRNVVRIAFPCRESSTASFTPSPSPPANYTVTSSLNGITDGERVPAWVSYRNNDSIAKYGRRACLITEEASSQISTRQHAYLMARAIIESLESPFYNLQIDCEFLPFVDVNNMVRVLPMHQVHTEAQKLAVVSYTHTVSGEGASTSVMLRGKPSSGYTKWLEQEARPSQGREPIDDIRNTTFDGRTSMRDVMNSVRDRFRIGSVPRPSTSIDVLPNWRFDYTSRGRGALPDGWRTVTSALNTNVFYSQYSVDGENAIIVNADQNISDGSGGITGRGIYSDLMPINRSASHALQASVEWGRKDGSGIMMQMGVIWYAADRTTIVQVGGNDIQTFSFAPAMTGNYDTGVWEMSSIRSITPPNDTARFFQIVLGAAPSANSFVVFDSVRLTRTEQRCQVWQKPAAISSAYGLIVDGFNSKGSDNQLTQMVFTDFAPFNYNAEAKDGYNVAGLYEHNFPSGSSFPSANSWGGFRIVAKTNGTYEFEYTYPVIIQTNKTPTYIDVLKNISLVFYAAPHADWNVSNFDSPYSLYHQRYPDSQPHPTGYTAIHLNRSPSILSQIDTGSNLVQILEYSEKFTVNLSRVNTVSGFIRDTTDDAWDRIIVHMGKDGSFPQLFFETYPFSMPSLRVKRILDQ
jgi:hypothetical protein